jgi:pyridoxamine 5'-phosphate oxidase
MSEQLSLAQLRQEYSKHELDVHMIHKNPVDQFSTWFKEALEAQIPEPNAFTLSTVGQDGYPSGRVLLLKEIFQHTFVFYTNYRSHKAMELEKSPKASMTFLWLELQRQIRIKGDVSKIDRNISETYFQSRPKESQLGAWVSPQSEVIPDRLYLDKKYADLEKEYKHTDVLPLPDFWGGYVLRPVEIEFWQGRTGRLHDRIRYKLSGDEWIIERLAP